MRKIRGENCMNHVTSLRRIQKEKRPSKLTLPSLFPNQLFSYSIIQLLSNDHLMYRPILQRDDKYALLHRDGYAGIRHFDPFD